MRSSIRSSSSSTTDWDTYSLVSPNALDNTPVNQRMWRQRFFSSTDTLDSASGVSLADCPSPFASSRESLQTVNTTISARAHKNNSQNTLNSPSASLSSGLDLADKVRTPSLKSPSSSISSSNSSDKKPPSVKKKRAPPIPFKTKSDNVKNNDVTSDNNSVKSQSDDLNKLNSTQSDTQVQYKSVNNNDEKRDSGDVENVQSRNDVSEEIQNDNESESGACIETLDYASSATSSVSNDDFDNDEDSTHLAVDKSVIDENDVSFSFIEEADDNLATLRREKRSHSDAPRRSDLPSFPAGRRRSNSALINDMRMKLLADAVTRQDTDLCNDTTLVTINNPSDNVNFKENDNDSKDLESKLMNEVSEQTHEESNLRLCEASISLHSKSDILQNEGGSSESLLAIETNEIENKSNKRKNINPKNQWGWKRNFDFVNKENHQFF